MEILYYGLNERKFYQDELVTLPSNHVSPIIGEIDKYLGKSINYIINGLTILQLPPGKVRRLPSGFP